MNDRIVRMAGTGVVAAILAGLPPGPFMALGEGLRNPPAGAFNLGRAGGRIAHVDDASAAQHNPANLADLTETTLALETTGVLIDIGFQGANGQNAETGEPMKVLPNLFAAIPLQDSRFTLGLGVTVPYGLAHKWHPSGAFGDQSNPLSLRYQAPHQSELLTFNVNPSVGVRLTDRLTFGAGFNAMYSELKLRQFYPWSAVVPGSPEGLFVNEGDGIGYGFNAGLTWEFAKGHRLAATYRSRIIVDYDGDSSLSGVPAPAAALGAQSNTHFRTDIQFPTIIAAGYGVQVTDRLRLEADVEWLEFSRFQALNIDIGPNGALFPSTSIPQDWKDTMTLGIGGDYRLSDQWIVRFSYQFYESPIPSHTLTPAIPGADQNVGTIGLGYRWGRHSAEFAYGYVDYAEHRATNPIASLNGTYDISVHLFSLAYRFAL